MSDLGFSPLSGLPLIHAVTTLERQRPSWQNTDPPTYSQYQVEGYYSYYPGEPGGGWATNLNFEPDGNQMQARAIRLEAPLQLGELDLKPAELQKLKAYALSIAVQSRLKALRYGVGKFPLFVSAREQRILALQEVLTPYNCLPYAIEDLWREAKRLTFGEKADQTLLNLALLEDTPGTSLNIAIAIDPPKELDAPMPEQLDEANARGRVLPVAPHGLVYGSVNGERPIVLASLLEDGLIATTDRFQYLGATVHESVGDHREIVKGPEVKGIRITPKGYRKIDELRHGVGNRQAFLVCPSKAPYRALYDQVCKSVGDHPEVGCEIKPVWANPHVERIDDRIFRLIREATIVVVDLDLSNFNVALEAGYALALGKPIVWTRKEPWDETNPFDIYSHMILKWSEAEPQKFEEDLRNQVLAAFDKAWSGR